MLTLTIILRVITALALLTAASAAFSERVPLHFKRYGYIVASVGAVALIALRLYLRYSMPEAVPSYSG